MTTKDRILEFIDFKKISKREFYLSTGLSNGFLDKVDNIGSDKLEKIISVYKELNLVWLVTGAGNMILGKKKDNPENVSIVNERDNNTYLINSLHEQIRLLKENNSDKQKIINLLEKEVAALKIKKPNVEEKKV